jgi:formylmethanofuran dehydrogenase subunit D
LFQSKRTIPQDQLKFLQINRSVSVYNQQKAFCEINEEVSPRLRRPGNKIMKKEGDEVQQYAILAHSWLHCNPDILPQ